LVTATKQQPDGESIRRQLERVLSGRTFADAERMSRFLRFAVEHSLSGNSARLKEIIIGLEVFDKPPSYDPRLDPIVRVEARRLRAKLAAYYQSEGQHDDLIIELPKGAYAPVFRPRIPPAETPRESTIAVLPLTNLSPEPDSDYFSDGLTEELIHALTKVSGLTVVAWNTAAQMKGREDDPAAVGEQLNVSNVLRGSVRRFGDRLRITAQLIDTCTGHYVWSENYERQFRDVFAIQAEIATAIVNALKLRLVRPDALQPKVHVPRNLESYNLYLKGRFHANERTPEALKRSVICFQKAIVLDPNCALAHAGLADAYSLLADYGLLSSAEGMPKAKAAAQRAIDLDPELGEAYTSLALIRAIYDWQWKDAESLYRRAIALNPGYATVHHWYALDFLAMVGRLEEATREIEIAHQLDPLSSIILEGRGSLRLLAREYDEAIEAYAKVLQNDPSFYKGYTSMGRVYTQKGSYEKAIQLLDKGRSLAPDVPNILGALGQTYALAGERNEARRLLSELEALAKRRYVPSTCFALVYAGLGEKSTALGWLETAAKYRELPLVSMYMHPAYDSLRNEPRFAALVKKIGFERAHSLP
jgi:serine/threonine-protein kinase